MYELSYWNNCKKETYEYIFKSLWAALFKARAILDSYGMAAEVMDVETGAIMAYIPKDGAPYVDSEVPKDLQNLIFLPIE